MSEIFSTFALDFEKNRIGSPRNKQYMAYRMRHITCWSEPKFRSLLVAAIRENRCCLCMDMSI